MEILIAPRTGQTRDCIVRIDAFIADTEIGPVLQVQVVVDPDIDLPALAGGFTPAGWLVQAATSPAITIGRYIQAIDCCERIVRIRKVIRRRHQANRPFNKTGTIGPFSERVPR